MSQTDGTYSLGFFFGPGLPRGLGVLLPSVICPRLLLLPASEPPLRFFEPSPLEFSAASARGVGAGVEADSETLSLISGTLSVELSSTAGAGDETAEGCDRSSTSRAGTKKRRKSFGGSLITAILDCFLFLSVRVEAEGDRVLEDDMICVEVLWRRGFAEAGWKSGAAEGFSLCKA